MILRVRVRLQLRRLPYDDYAYDYYDAYSDYACSYTVRQSGLR